MVYDCFFNENMGKIWEGREIRTSLAPDRSGYPTAVRLKHAGWREEWKEIAGNSSKSIQKKRLSRNLKSLYYIKIKKY
jgi:hypothetical protein